MSSQIDFGDRLASALGLEPIETPFPWQLDLIARFGRGDVPSSVDIPTGLGKTSVMAMWVLARASGANVPRRLVYVVDRRAVVDQASQEAIALRAFVERDAAVRDGLGLQGRSLPISTLRGQHIDNREWLEDPSSPAIIVGTVDMVGSRLLFEGYGVSRKMRPYHAGLLGADTLIVLDEAHLVPPFERLLDTIATERARFGPSTESLAKLVPGFKLLSLSATGRSDGGAVGLEKADLGHPTVHKRLAATKRLFLKMIEPATEEAAADGERKGKAAKPNLADALAGEAWTLAKSGPAPRILVFCDSRDVARDVRSRVEAKAKLDGIEDIAEYCEFFVGGRRVFDREEARKRVEALGFLAKRKSAVARVRPAFLFATSAAEVGVDLDADHMVCDLVSWERMVQRLGRVNRRGDGDARIVVLEPAPTANAKETKAIEKRERGEELDEAEEKLLSKRDQKQVERMRWRNALALLPARDGHRDASPGAIRELKLRARSDAATARLLEDASTPAPLRPALTRALVDAWSMTSLEEHTGRPAVEPWLRGWDENDRPQTVVVWRTHLPVRLGERAVTKKEIESFFEAAPPHASEELETETQLVVKWLEGRAEGLRKAADSAAREPGITAEVPPLDREAVVGFVLARDGTHRRALHLQDFEFTEDDYGKKARKAFDEGLRGLTFVVDARVGGLREGLLDSNEDSTPRTADDGQEWLGEHVIHFRVRSTAAGESVARDPEWRERLRFAAEVSAEGEVIRWLVVDKWRHDAATEDDRSAARSQLLDEHQSWTEAKAGIIMRRLGFPDDHPYVQVLRVAARSHDEGKRALRWQLAFHAHGDGVYAKTRGPISHAILDGYRHELGSLPLASRDPSLGDLPEELRDLVLHMIAAHHGFARPIIGTRGCEDAPPSVVEERARDVVLRFARLQRRWGPWGLAWWEALLRAADQQASRDNDARKEDAVVVVGSGGTDHG